MNQEEAAGAGGRSKWQEQVAGAGGRPNFSRALRVSVVKHQQKELGSEAWNYGFAGFSIQPEERRPVRRDVD